MWEVDTALEGSLRAGESVGSEGAAIYQLELSGKEIFQLQRLLEELAVESGNYFRVRVAVLLSEAVRKAVKEDLERGRPQGAIDGREKVYIAATAPGGKLDPDHHPGTVLPHARAQSRR